MEDFTYIDKVRKIIKMRHDDIVSAMASGGVDNMEKYKYLVGQAHAIQLTLQDISNLLKPKEQKDEQGTVIDLDKRSPMVVGRASENLSQMLDIRVDGTGHKGRLGVFVRDIGRDRGERAASCRIRAAGTYDSGH
mgnify:CR=1 FL=1